MLAILGIVGPSKWTGDQTLMVPSAPPRTDQRRGRPRVSLCMIVRNEEANLPACLESVGDICDEIVVVDTGSTDATQEVATRFGARLDDFPWCDCFASARNES